jgi:hypothetical protein
MAPVITHTVHATPWARGWELRIEGLGVTQSRSLQDAERMARDYISLDTGADPRSIHVKIIPELGGLERDAEEAREAVARADQAQRAAAARSRETARRLRSAGLSGRDIAAVMRLSPQRVSQLLRGWPVKTGTSRHRIHAAGTGR